MNDFEKKELRFALETQYRYKLYNDPAFPFFPSLGIKDILQGFAHDDEFIGTLHLHWVNKDNGIVYEKIRHTNIKGVWEATWYDTAEEGIRAGEKVVDDSPFDALKVTEMVVRNHIKQLKHNLPKKVQNDLEELFEEEINTKDKLLN
jgi:hypothetical protein